MKIQLKQQCVIGGNFFPLKRRGYPQTHEAKVSLLKDDYLDSLFSHGSLSVVDITEDELKEFGEEAFKGLSKDLQQHLIDLFQKIDQEARAKNAPPKAFDFGDHGGDDDLDDDLTDEDSEAELSEKKRLEDEAAEKSKADADALKSEQIEAAKKELAELSEKKNLSNKDKKRVDELNKIIGA